MLTDNKLRNLKPADKIYKVPDRDGLYVAVTPAGSVSFRYNYSINGRQETLTIGQYGASGITLAEARERLNDAKKMIADGKSPAKEKTRQKTRQKGAETFWEWAAKWFKGHQMADSTSDMRQSTYDRELAGAFGKANLPEITHEDLRRLTDAIVALSAQASAVHAREVVMQVFRWAIERGVKVGNPADLVRPGTMAKFESRNRALTLEEIGVLVTIPGLVVEINETIPAIMDRLLALEQQTKDETGMTTYALTATAGTAASTLVGSASVTKLQLLNKSSATVGIAFGAAPARIDDAGLLTLAPGAALDTDLIPGAPIFVIASAAGSEVTGLFAVPRGAPNPNFEEDFRTLLAGMESIPAFAWESAYRKLYSALRRNNILDKAQGLYLPLSHSAAAGALNWGAPGTSMVAVGVPSWVLGQGFIYNGVGDYHETNLVLQAYTVPTNVGAVVWTGAGPAQGSGKSAMGDGSVSLEPNRSDILAAVKTATANADTVPMPGLGAMLGVSRFAADRATVFRPGGKHATVVRESISSLPVGRTMIVGASNSSTGIGSFYAGAIKAAFFGKALDAQQILAFEVAMNDYFTAASEAIAAGV